MVEIKGSVPIPLLTLLCEVGSIYMGSLNLINLAMLGGLRDAK